MRIDIYWLNNGSVSRIGIMPRPRGGDWLEDEIRALKASCVDVVVSLLDKPEIDELDLEDESAYCEAYGITYLNFPIVDRGVPESKEGILELSRKLIKILAEGKNIVIHCRQGVGRSAIIAAVVKVLQGDQVETIFEKISLARGCEVPDTKEQYDWVINLARKEILLPTGA
jgi:protein-tyrosine phosphatase